MKFKPILNICILALIISSCAKPPVAEMDSAREAVLRAENDQDAVLYAGSSLTRARDALRRMENEANSKRYDAARTYAAEAVAAAEKAVADGKTGAARARDQAATMLDGLGLAINETGRNLNAARSARLDLDYQQLNSELDSALRNLDLAEIDNVMGRYGEAVDKGRNARASIGSINQQISNASTSVSRKK
jgi:flagellar biosynthesis/type III secretory pathway protein FliH